MIDKQKTYILEEKINVKYMMFMMINNKRKKNTKHYNRGGVWKLGRRKANAEIEEHSVKSQQ